MKPPDFDPQFFRFLDKIKEKYGTSDAEWAEASGFHQPRISETRKYIRLLHEGKMPSDYKQAAWDPTKWLALLRGMRKLIGPEKMRNELLAEVKKTEDLEIKIELALRSLDDSEKKRLLLLMDAAFQLEIIDYRTWR